MANVKKNIHRNIHSIEKVEGGREIDLTVRLGPLRPPRPCSFLSNFLQPFFAQLLGTGVTALLPAKFAEGDCSGVLLTDGLFGRFWRRGWFGQRLPLRLFHDGAGELADIGGFRFFACAFRHHDAIMPYQQTNYIPRILSLEKLMEAILTWTNR
jgi:hypothetical protein